MAGFDYGKLPDPRTLDLIMWSLRLPLLRAAFNEDPEDPRLGDLILEGERALGILPPEAGDE